MPYDFDEMSQTHGELYQPRPPTLVSQAQMPPAQRRKGRLERTTSGITRSPEDWANELKYLRPEDVPQLLMDAEGYDPEQRSQLLRETVLPALDARRGGTDAHYQDVGYGLGQSIPFAVTGAAAGSQAYKAASEPWVDAAEADAQYAKYKAADEINREIGNPQYSQRESDRRAANEAYRKAGHKVGDLKGGMIGHAERMDAPRPSGTATAPPPEGGPQMPAGARGGPTVPDGGAAAQPPPPNDPGARAVLQERIEGSQQDARRAGAKATRSRWGAGIGRVGAGLGGGLIGALIPPLLQGGDLHDAYGNWREGQEQEEYLQQLARGLGHDPEMGMLEKTGRALAPLAAPLHEQMGREEAMQTAIEQLNQSDLPEEEKRRRMIDELRTSAGL